MAKTETEILKETIDALEKLLQIKDAIIGEQERRLSEREQIRVRPAVMPSRPYQPSPSPYSPVGFCPASPNFSHDYGNLLGSTQHNCIYCGSPSSLSGLGIASGSTSGNPTGV
jgi:hypothetical protein